MVRKKVEGNEQQKRAEAREARRRGQQPSEYGATTGASKQRTEAKRAMSHQERLDLKRQGKQMSEHNDAPTARPGSRDADSPDRERHPRRHGRSED